MCVIGCTTAQNYSTDSKKAIKFFKQASQLLRDRDFDNGQIMLEKSLKADPDFVEALVRLGYVKNLFKEKERATKLYGRACELKPNDKSMSNNYFIAAELYFGQGDYEKAKKYYQMTIDYPPTNTLTVKKAKSQIQACDFASDAQNSSMVFEPKLMHRSINRGTFQSYPCLTADKKYMIFSIRNYSGRGMAYNENIYISKVTDDGRWMSPVPISKNINSDLNEGTNTISADGKTLVFTACNRPESIGGCDLYISFKQGDEWTEPLNMGSSINSKEWDSEPSLSADGRTLFFSSTRPGGSGEEDIWYTTKQANGTWGSPRNLGPQINTPQREVSPFIHVDGSTLYFASTGYPGMGKFDLYRSILTDTGWTTPKNLGYPLNTPGNESSLFITADYEKGYFAKYTQVTPQEATSYLYEFDVPEQLKTVNKSSYASGHVYDAISKKTIGASIELVNLNSGKIVQKVKSDSLNGEYLIVLTEGSEYALWVRKEGYLTHSFNFSADKFDPVALDVYLNPLSSKGAIVLNNVFFETAKYDLKEKSKFELDSYAQLLIDNPEIKIEIGGHTDNVGASDDNKKLSLNRAKAVYEYMLEKGIAKSRLSYRGYGETAPVAENNTDQGRAKNRRIEFKIL